MNRKLSVIIRTIFFSFLIMASLASFAQKVKKLEFRYVEQKEGSQFKTVVFTIVGNTNEKTTASLIKATEGIESVNSFKIFYNRRCKMVIDERIGAMGVRKLLLKYGLDFDLDYVIVNDKMIELEMLEKKEVFPVLGYTPQPVYEYQCPENFPKFSNTGDPQKDKANFENAKQKWAEENPESYKVMTGVEYLDYSMDLNKKNK